MIPSLIDDYNQYMGGVDIADQLRPYNTTHFRGMQNWLPLFYWLLDTTLVNSYILYQFYESSTTPKASQQELCTMLIHERVQGRVRNCSQLHNFLQRINSSSKQRRSDARLVKRKRCTYKCFKCDNSFCLTCK